MGDGWAEFAGKECEADGCERCAVVFVNDILLLCLGAIDGMLGMYYVVVAVVGGVGACGRRHLWGEGEWQGERGAENQRRITITSWKKSFSGPQQIITRPNLKFLITT